MLMLTLELDEWVVIRDRDRREVARLQLTRSNPARATLGFVAPREVVINREEIDKRKAGNGE